MSSIASSKWCSTVSSDSIGGSATGPASVAGSVAGSSGGLVDRARLLRRQLVDDGSPRAVPAARAVASPRAAAPRRAPDPGRARPPGRRTLRRGWSTRRPAPRAQPRRARSGSRCDEGLAARSPRGSASMRALPERPARLAARRRLGAGASPLGGAASSWPVSDCASAASSRPRSASGLSLLGEVGVAGPARGPERLVLEARKLVVLGAMPALQVEVLPDRVVENSHRLCGERRLLRIAAASCTSACHASRARSQPTFAAEPPEPSRRRARSPALALEPPSPRPRPGSCPRASPRTAPRRRVAISSPAFAAAPGRVASPMLAVTRIVAAAVEQPAPRSRLDPLADPLGELERTVRVRSPAARPRTPRPRSGPARRSRATRRRAPGRPPAAPRRPAGGRRCR